MPSAFADRTDAAEQLVAALRERGVEPDVVLAIPRGALPIGRVVADAFGVPLDVVVAKKIGAPNNPEYALGAVTDGGAVWRNERGLAGVEEGYFERERDRMEREARERAERYREDRPAVDLSGKTVLLVDDGVATGATSRACLQALRGASPERVVLAVPVGPPDTVDSLRGHVDELVCLRTPPAFGGVGRHYARFDQVSDEAARRYLDG